MALKPSWSVYHGLGVEVASMLSPNYSYEQIGAELGISKQKAYHEAMLALGKVVYQLKKTYSADNAR